ncbi:histidinol-phosphatase [candidate division KSB1 bacterium]|nr:histidinol-phosphatase [candidate division KSB1 bacterium]
MEKTNNIFKNGSIWLKADFHLHTKADKKEFKYGGEDNDFVKEYIKELKKNNVGIGIITNHNKFDLDEYNALRKKAVKENIYLIAGVELSVNDGSNGIHCLIAFEYESWIKDGDDFIEQFLNSAFEGIANRENENTRCQYSLSDLFKKLEEHRKAGRDSFIVMAHIEQKSGFCNELDGGRIQQFATDEHFKKNVLGFQKLRTNDLKNNLAIWFNGKNNIPVFVEGSDPKNLKEVGVSGKQKDKNRNEIKKESFIKIGDYNFEAVEYSLTDRNNRISKKKPEINNAYIKSIIFEGGLLDQTEINLSPELNNFIGIRGSGKSSVLEILRYTLGISLGSQASDRDYKNNLIEHVLKSGGKVIVTVVNEHKKEYRIEKIYGQKEDIYDNDGRVDAPSADTVFQKPVYFGQKDLSNKNIDFEADLVKKLIGNKLENLQARIIRKINEIENIVSAFKKLDNLDELKREIKASKDKAEYQLKIYKEKGVEDKLRQQSRFDSDESKFKESINEVTNFKNELESLINDYSTFFNQTIFKSEENKKIFLEADNLFKLAAVEFNKLNDIKLNTAKYIVTFNEIFKKLNEKKENLKEDFAKIKREIDIPNLNPDNFLKLNRQVEISRLKLIEIDKAEKKRAEYTTSLNSKISELNNLWHEEFHVLEEEVKRINEYDSSLSILVEYKDRKDKFLEKLQQVFKGSGIRGATYESIKSQYKDFVEIYRDLENLGSKLNISESLLAEFKMRFNDNILDLITFRVEDKFTIKYNNKPLKDHSLGQRATALILFLLAQKETNVLIIDQPEDDLDNQTIYEDVIKAIKSLKGEMQFIFATHNANIPVLGDSEKIISCKYSEDKIDVFGGTIDNQKTQKQIVTIMEGGEEAFNRRKNIYEIWSMKK